MSRSLLRTAAVLVVVVLAVGMPVAGATTELTGGGSGALAASVGELPDRTAQVDFGSTAGTQPGWLVTVGADSQASLTDWANGSDSRVIKRTVARANTTTAVVAAPRAAIGATLFTRVLNRGLVTSRSSNGSNHWSSTRTPSQSG